MSKYPKYCVTNKSSFFKKKKSINGNVFEPWSKPDNTQKKNKIKIAFSNKIKALKNFCENYTICAHYNRSTPKFQKSMA